MAGPTSSRGQTRGRAGGAARAAVATQEAEPISRQIWDACGRDAEVMAKLQNPVAIGVMDQLYEQEASVSELAARLGVGLPCLSAVTNRLAQAELISGERAGFGLTEGARVFWKGFRALRPAQS